MNFKTYLKSKIKYVVGVASIAALLSQLIMPALGTQAAEPRFNFLTGDLEMIRGANVTRGENVWKNPVDGQAGDEFRGIVYYHNGVLDTTAQNTKIKINIPTATTNKTAKITGSISADNASTVTATIVDGRIVGHDGLIVNFDQDTNLEFVPGSVKWFPNGSKTPVQLPFGQSGNEIVSGNGVNIDGINGCWEFAGYLTFGFKSKQKVTPPTITINKTVKNLTKNDSSFKQETTAEAGDTLLYNIAVTTSSSTQLTNVNVKDVLPASVIYEAGSLTRLPSTTYGAAEVSQFFDGGLNINVAAGQGVVTTFQFKAKVKTGVKDCFINKAIATLEGNSVYDTAQVCMVAPNIEKHKSAYNVTQKEAANIVNPGDVIDYTLNTKNTGTAAVTNYVIEDDITKVLTYADMVSISDGGQLVVSGNSKLVRWPGVTINPGQSIDRKFSVKIKNPLPDNNACNYKMVNVYGNEVTLTIKCPPVPPVMTISKYVRNITMGETNYVKSNQAFAGDTLEYRINFTNSGTVPVDQVRVYDVLPPNTEYIAGTTVISRNGGAEQTLLDGVTTGGIVLDTVAVGESDYIKFRVKTSTGLAAGQVLVNTGFLKFDNKTISDTAETKILAKGVIPVKQGPTTLPKTGPTSAASFIITFMAGIMFLFMRYRKLAYSEENLVINNLLMN